MKKNPILMKNNQETTAQTPGTLLNDLRALVADAEKMIADSRGESTAELMDALRERFDAAQERLTGLYTKAKRKSLAGAHCTDAAIRTNPYQALAIAAGVGLLAGVLASGRRSP